MKYHWMKSRSFHLTKFIFALGCKSGQSRPNPDHSAGGSLPTFHIKILPPVYVVFWVLDRLKHMYHTVMLC